jgi:hypothetical protein
LAEADEVVFEAKANSLITTIEEMLVATAHLKQNIILNDNAATVQGVFAQKAAFQHLTDKSRFLLAESGKDISDALDRLKETTITADLTST